MYFEMRAVDVKYTGYETSFTSSLGIDDKRNITTLHACNVHHNVVVDVVGTAV